MRKKIVSVVLILFIILSFQARSEASLPTFDSVNAALNQMRNLLIQSQFAQEITLALERLDQLRTTYYEFIRFHSGLDDFFEVFMGDPLNEILRLGSARAKEAFFDFDWFIPKLELLDGAESTQDIRRFLEEVTGEIPNSMARPYIPFEEMQVVEGFQFADEIRRAGEITREGAEQISYQARTASPKGAARLQVEAMSRMIVLTQENQEALAKLIELESTSIEQVSRDEKHYERERLRYMEEFKEGLESLWRVR